MNPLTLCLFLILIGAILILIVDILIKKQSRTERTEHFTLGDVGRAASGAVDWGTGVANNVAGEVAGVANYVAGAVVGETNEVAKALALGVDTVVETSNEVKNIIEILLGLNSGGNIKHTYRKPSITDINNKYPCTAGHTCTPWNEGHSKVIYLDRHRPTCSSGGFNKINMEWRKKYTDETGEYGRQRFNYKCANNPSTLPTRSQNTYGQKKLSSKNERSLTDQKVDCGDGFITELQLVPSGNYVYYDYTCRNAPYGTSGKTVHKTDPRPQMNNTPESIAKFLDSNTIAGTDNRNIDLTIGKECAADEVLQSFVYKNLPAPALPSVTFNKKGGGFCDMHYQKANDVSGRDAEACAIRCRNTPQCIRFSTGSKGCRISISGNTGGTPIPEDGQCIPRVGTSGNPVNLGHKICHLNYMEAAGKTESQCRQLCRDREGCDEYSLGVAENKEQCRYARDELGCSYNYFTTMTPAERKRDIRGADNPGGLAGTIGNANYEFGQSGSTWNWNNARPNGNTFYTFDRHGDNTWYELGGKTDHGKKICHGNYHNEATRNYGECKRRCELTSGCNEFSVGTGSYGECRYAKNGGKCDRGGFIQWNKQHANGNKFYKLSELNAIELDNRTRRGQYEYTCVKKNTPPKKDFVDVGRRKCTTNYNTMSGNSFSECKKKCEETNGCSEFSIANNECRYATNANGCCEGADCKSVLDDNESGIFYKVQDNVSAPNDTL